MKFTILIPYRPSRGGLDSPISEIFQDENCIWKYSDGTIFGRPPEYGEQDITRAVRAIRKNSVYNHKIVIVIDSDMNYHENWLKLLGNNVEIFKASYVVDKANCKTIPQSRQANALCEAILSRSADELVCFCYISDLVCEKYWDLYIEEAYKSLGDEYVYTPMFVEPRTIHGCNTAVIGPTVKHLIDPMGDLTAKNIWENWRLYCCHALTIKPPTDRDYFIESDLDQWSIICNSANKGVITEPCGSRYFGYWAPIISRNERFRRNVSKLAIGMGGDLAFEGSLGKKAVVTKSHVFHFHLKCELDNIAVEHKEG